MTIKIDAVTFNNDQNAESEWHKPRVLSKEATQEILNDKLSALIGIDTDGKPFYYLPYGTDISSISEHTESEVATLLNFEVKIPVQEAAFQAKSFKLCQPAGGGPPRPCPC